METPSFRTQFLQKTAPRLCERALRQPLAYVALAASMLVIDFFTGPFIQFPITYIVPVGLAAWFLTPLWGYGLAIAMSFCRFAFAFAWTEPTTFTASEVNLAIRTSVLFLIVYLLQRTAAQTRQLEHEVNLLEGILPICSHCKKIRDDDAQNWEPIETYIAKHTDADFSHGICPACMEEHYGEIFRRAAARKR